MATTSEPEVVAEWRPRGWRGLTLVLPVLVFVTTGTAAALRLLQPGPDRLAVLDVVAVCSVALGAGLSVVVAARTRVRVLPAGVQVRELRTRTYPWSQIVDVRVDRWSGRHTVQLDLADGTVRTLPVPCVTRGGADELPVALEVIGARLPADRERRPRDEPTALDDLLHE